MGNDERLCKFYGWLATDDNYLEKVMSTQPKIEDELDEIWRDGHVHEVGEGWVKLSEMPAKTKVALLAIIAREKVQELEHLVRRGDIAWVKRDNVDSHEEFVHTNIIKDRIAALTQDDSSVGGGKR